MDKRELLSAEHVYKYFDGTPILQDINLKIKSGEVVVIIGPSGCGKSTLLRCLNGLEKIAEGKIELDGDMVDPASKEICRLRERIGMVFQSYELFPHKTILDNITLAPIKVQKRKRTEAEEEALKLLERIGLSAHKDKRPSQLSGGQKQRVAIARALIMHPELLLLDEITAALDPEMVREVLEVVLDLAKEGRTMLIVTHEMAFARAVADRIIFMDEGRIIEEGTPERIFEAPETERLQRFLDNMSF
ncbi:MAG: amino acid ABC transporter ATP-binding protein [Lachnospiraceae bacterium]|nr:amino acid ABC transporter ATP-binding protein [Lachnospiraceae bacterium]